MKKFNHQKINIIKNIFPSKTIVWAMILVCLFMNNSTLIVYAQETQNQATQSATISPSQTVTPAPSATFSSPDSDSVNPFKDEESDFKIIELIKKAFNLFKKDNSESEEKQINIRKLAKKTYKSTEKIRVIVDGDDADKVKVEIFSVDGERVDSKVEKTENAESAVLTIVPPDHFKPGRYRLKVIDSKGEISTQDFSWGVLAINTNKSVYKQEDVAKIHMAVLDETGNMVCDAKVKLTVKDPRGAVTDHTTEENSVAVNPECEKKEYTMVPDFESRYSVLGGEGVYEMTLTAQTKNGSYTITDSFQAQESPAFDVERTTNTRIFPPLRYPVLFNITATEDFKGEVTEVVPESFDIGFIKNMSFFSVATRSAEPKEETSALHFLQPFTGSYKMTQGFGEEETDPLLSSKYQKYGVTGHDGVDFSLPSGTPVLAVDDGMVVRAEENSDYGTTVVIQHEWGKSYYGHLSKFSKVQGDFIKKQEELGLSGDTGLSTNPHLHFGIKLKDSDPANGYYGKINPLPYVVSGSEVEGVATSSASVRTDSGDGVQILTWEVDVKKGETVKLGYTYLAPPESPQFYTLGPLEFAAKEEGQESQLIFKEARVWQIAVDADGSGTMTVTPTAGSISSTGNEYEFIFTPTENMDSGQIQIQVPSSGSPNWSTPQGSAGAAGYTRALGGVAATVANVLNENDVLTGWSEDDVDYCSLAAVDDIVLDAAVKKEGTGSIRCDNTPISAGPDNNDSFGFDYGSNQNWATACDGGACTRVSYWIMRTAGASGTNAEFAWGSGTDLTATRLGGCTVPATPTAGVWVYAKCTLSGTLTTVRSYGFRCTNNTCNPFETADVNIDELLIGPGVPTFSGRNINVRLLEASVIDTVRIMYGSGGGANGVTNSSTEGVHTFTALSKTSVSGTLANIATHPTVTLSSGPTIDQLMRHGNWFNGGVEQPFTF